MHIALKNMWASVAIEAGAVLDRDRSGVGDLTLETRGLRPVDRSRPSDLTLAGWGGPACDYMIDFACVFSMTPTWGNDPRWCIPGIAATEAERNKLAADRASSAPRPRTNEADRYLTEANKTASCDKYGHMLCYGVYRAAANAAAHTAPATLCAPNTPTQDRVDALDLLDTAHRTLEAAGDADEAMLTYLRRFKAKKALTPEEQVAERLIYSRVFDAAEHERSANVVDGVLAALEGKRIEVVLAVAANAYASATFKRHATERDAERDKARKENDYKAARDRREQRHP
eukprot:jgi/Tetstr1/466524/TSEL_011031.t1